MKVTLSQGVTNARGKALDVSWEEFCNLMRQHSVARSNETDDTKREGTWFSPVEYRNGHRRRENILGRPWAVVVDLDKIRDAKAVERALKRYEYLAWTTWKSTPEKPRWRVVLPIDGGGIAPDQFSKLVDKVLKPIGTAADIDSRSRMPEQLWFVPIHKRSQAANHRIWHNAGRWVKPSETISVDFTGVKMATKPEEVDEGERNNMLVLRLSEDDAMRAAHHEELLEIAEAWNARLKNPMTLREVRSVVRKKWAWMNSGTGVTKRAAAWRGHLKGEDLPDVGVGQTSNEIRTATLPPSLVGDFLYPGATMISAKMKEGKSFLAMQLAMSIATGTPFLKGARHPGFVVKKREKTIIIAGEDTKGGIAARFMGSIASGHLPTLDKSTDVKLLFNDDLDTVRKAHSVAPGLVVFEALVKRWYEQGYRVIAIDPLRVLEAALGIDDYPGWTLKMNAHAKDFQTMRYYTKIAQQYNDLVILVSMHHGKNKRDHDASDPGDMIAGTTGFGAGAMTTISLLPIDDRLNADEDPKHQDMVPKRRELYLHGRYTREYRVLIEQDLATGVWHALGNVADELMGQERQRYFEALLTIGGNTRYVSAEEIAKQAGGRTKAGTVHKVLSRARRKGNTYLGWRLVVKRGLSGGYRLVGGTTQ